MRLLNELKDRVIQLDNRIFMIKKYVANPGVWLGGKNFRLEDIPDLEKQVQETKAAIWGIEKWNKDPDTYKLNYSEPKSNTPT